MKIQKIEVKKLFGQYDITWNIHSHVSVLVGQNGSGKSTLLKLIYALFKNNEYTKEEMKQLSQLFDECTLVFQDGSSSSIKINDINEEGIDDIIKLLLDFKKNKVDNNILSKIEQLLQKTYIFNGKNENCHIELISTVSLSANTMNTISTGDGRALSVLDLEMEYLLSEFIKVQKDLKKLCVDKLNQFLETSDKQIHLKGQEITFYASNKVLPYSAFSSGEKQLIYTFIKTIIGVDYAKKHNKTMILLLDEPEISLHLSWQEGLLKALSDMNPNGQIIVVTHSPAIVINGWNDVYIDIEDIMQ